jgi:hypothetical protein
MTERERAHQAYLEDAVIDRERRILALASLLRGINRGEDPVKCCIDLKIEPNEARILGILNYEKASEIRETAG